MCSTNCASFSYYFKMCTVNLALKGSKVAMIIKTSTIEKNVKKKIGAIKIVTKFTLLAIQASWQLTAKSGLRPYLL